MSALRRRLSLAQARGLHHAPNMTPMVDVVMVILVFFMASSAVLGPEWFIKSALPVRSASAGTATDTLRLEFTLRSVPSDSDGASTAGAAARASTRTVVTGESLTDAPLSALALRLEQLAKDNAGREIAVLLKPDANVPMQDLVFAHDACNRLGIAKVGMTPLSDERGTTTTPSR
ncbi:MAG: biopolymer transporter ExbD [Phycisphaerales bacterium]|jgi:biopolymer transport protein ExbD|nr:biopolymer transporter ExbD [Phycisphaerales bacterium]